MNRSVTTSTPNSLDAALAEMLEAIAERVQAGEPIDGAALAREHPEYADRLLALLPAVQVLADLSHSSEASSAGATGALLFGELGDYRLIREVGRGGMGIVYEAEQMSLHRPVALKVLPFAATMDSRQLQRFRHEAQAAALLHHANIVPVYGVGCERGVHFYAMQLIDGRSLAAVIDEQRGEANGRTGSAVAGLCEAGPGSQTPATENRDGRPPAPTVPVAALTTQRTRRDKGHYRGIAELVAQAADALEYAHQQGVVHRDIKPANLLLDDAGHLWVTDFGLARLGDGTGLTASGDLLGTLRYMSPEQALAKHGLVDHRTDVYSLGATLYELLTLRPAVTGADKQAALRQIAFEEPTPPRKLDATIPPELETIALKALAKEPADRYPSAGEFAADLCRWLSHQTIRARRPSLAQRADKWMRRHSTAVIAAAAALLLGTGVSTWQAMKAWNAERRATTEAAIAKAVNDFLQRDLLRQADVQVHGEDGFTEEPDLTVKEALNRAATRIGTRFGDQPLVEAAIRMVIGDAYRQIGECSLALPHFDRALVLRQANLGDRHPDTLSSMGRLADAFMKLGRWPDAVALAEKIHAKQMILLGPEHALALASMSGMAEYYRRAGMSEQAVLLHEGTLRKREALFGPTHPATLASMHELAMTYTDLGRFEEAFVVYRTALQSSKETLGLDHGQTSGLMFSYGRTCLMAGKVADAERLSHELIADRRKLGGTSGVVSYAQALVLRSQVLLKQERFVEAESIARQAQAVYEDHRTEFSGPDHWYLFHAMSLVGGALLGQKRYAEAEPFLLQGHEGMKQREATIDVPLRYWLTATLERVIQYYEAINQPENARTWREKLPLKK